MRRTLLLLTLSLGLFAFDATAQPSGGGGGMGMMRRPDMRTKFMFAQFCFDLSATDAQVAKALPLFRETLARQKATMDKYPDPTDEAMNEMQKIQADLEAKVKALLTPEQQKKLADLEAQQQQWRGRGGSGGGPPR